MSGGYESRKRDRRDAWSSKKQQKLSLTADEDLESKLGFDLFSEGDTRLGWLLTFASVSFILHFPTLPFHFRPACASIASGEFGWAVEKLVILIRMCSLRFGEV